MRSNLNNYYVCSGNSHHNSYKVDHVGSMRQQNKTIESHWTTYDIPKKRQKTTVKVFDMFDDNCCDCEIIIWTLKAFYLIRGFPTFFSLKSHLDKEILRRVALIFGR